MVSTSNVFSQRAHSVFPKRTEQAIVLLIVLSLVWTLRSRWNLQNLNTEDVRNLEPRQLPRIHHASHTPPTSTPVKPHGIYFPSKLNFQQLLHDSLTKGLASTRQPAAVPSPKLPTLEPLTSLETDIDLLQARFLDFLNNEEGRDEPAVFGGSLLNLTAPFNLHGTWSRVHSYALQTRSLTYNRTQFLHLGRRARALHIAHVLLHDQPSLLPFLVARRSITPLLEVDVAALRGELVEVVRDLTTLLYPWLAPTHRSIRAMQNHFRDATEQTGIVICSGKWHFEMAVHLILTLRNVLNCTLPIEIHYAGPDDTTPRMLRAFRALPRVRAVNLLRSFPDETRHWGGWSLKPYAALASAFRRVILVDADALFFADPRVLVEESVRFRRFGQVFFHDRTLGANDAWWFKEINPVRSRVADGLRYMGKDVPRSSQHEMESGVVVVDKARSGVLHALLMVCKMNQKVERDGVTYHRVYGDKETFWISWELVRVPYAFTPSFGGTVGYLNDKGHVCGGLFHTDERFKPLWWNGGVLANKHISKDAEFMKFEYAAFDTTGEKVEWEWETKTTPFCLGPQWPEKEVIALSTGEKERGARFVDLYRDIQKDGWEAYFQKNYGLSLE
ncbi:mannosyltransferase putative-domain-containing protein [Chytriomyces sp. MP71]|nr:mannosyltransferase putative-domain-containing protein [Chytriomyces sp. MP71]